MSDTSAFPFGSAGGSGDDAARPDRRKLLLFVAVGVLAVALVGYLLTAVIGGKFQGKAPPAGGPSLPPIAGGPLALPGASAQPSPNASPAPTPGPQSFAITGDRNPFIPLVTEGAGAGSGAVPAIPGTPGGTLPAVPGTPGGTGSAPSPSPSGAPTTTTFKLVSVSGTYAAVTINEKSYTVKPGQTFATKYRLITISDGKCAEFTQSGNPLSLCEGQTVTF